MDYPLLIAAQLHGTVKLFLNLREIRLRVGGSAVGDMMMNILNDTVQIVRECIASGKNYGEVAVKHHVSCQQVRTWTLRFEQMGEAGLQDRRGQRKKD